MAEGLRPLTLLLAGAALWALSLLILALGGLGSNFPPPTVAAAPPPVPKVSLARTESRLGPYEVYSVVATRPLMNERRKPVAISAVAADEAGASELDVTLTSVLITPGMKLAILTDNKDGGSRRVRLGEAVEGSAWRLVALEPRRAIIEGAMGQRTLELRVFDGRSGEAPTPIAATETPTTDPTPAPVPTPTPPPKPPVAQNVAPAPPANTDSSAMTQEQQVEAIRRRIEARRAQMRAEAANDAAVKR